MAVIGDLSVSWIPRFSLNLTFGHAIINCDDDEGPSFWVIIANPPPAYDVGSGKLSSYFSLITLSVNWLFVLENHLSDRRDGNFGALFLFQFSMLSLKPGIAVS
jgi:hypothetical protein